MERNINFLIEHQCPQCGAPAVLEETDRLFACEFCRVKSYLVGGKYFRYMLPNNASDDKDVVFFPYWRFKGMGFSCVLSGIKNKIIDISQQAIESRFFPFSVGFRSQVLKLRFVTSGVKGHFLNPRVPYEKTKEIIGERAIKKSSADPVFHQAFIGENLSLIYSPFYVDGNKVHDAVLNKPVSTVLPDDFDMEAFDGGEPSWDIRFIASLCPDCGWDLSGERESLVMNCRNCNSVWHPSGNGFRKIKFAHIHIPGEDKKILYLPFWRIRPDVSGIALESYEDFVKLANLPKVVKNNNRDNDFYFWTLAFKVRPKVFLNAARNLTISQPQQELKHSIPEDRLYPVTLPVNEAVESIKVNLADFMRPRNTIPQLLPGIEIKPKSLTLVYIPFIEDHHEFIQPAFQLAIHKNILSMAGHL